MLNAERRYCMETDILLEKSIMRVEQGILSVNNAMIKNWRRERYIKNIKKSSISYCYYK